MFVYSGKCRLCETGKPTPIFDRSGRRLHTGDIVMISTESYIPEGLTVVVSDQFQSYSDGTHVERENGVTYFVMGIKGSGSNDDGHWNILRTKSHSDVVDGEHWPEYGFSFSEK